jgi:hypothetical protein
MISTPGGRLSRAPGRRSSESRVIITTEIGLSGLKA